VMPRPRAASSGSQAALPDHELQAFAVELQGHLDVLTKRLALEQRRNEALARQNELLRQESRARFPRQFPPRSQQVEIQTDIMEVAADVQRESTHGQQDGNGDEFHLRLLAAEEERAKAEERALALERRVIVLEAQSAGHLADQEGGSEGDAELQKRLAAAEKRRQEAENRAKQLEQRMSSLEEQARGIRHSVVAGEVGPLVASPQQHASSETRGDATDFLQSVATQRISEVQAALENDHDGQLLLATMPDTGAQALHLAVTRGNEHVAKLLIQTAQKRLDQQRHMISLQNQLEARKLAQAIDGPDAAGRTPLAELLRQPEPSQELMIGLIKAKADLKARASNGTTPFLECVRAGHSSIAKTLLQVSNGAVLSDADNHGRLPLHTAAAAGHLEIANMLLQLKAEAEAQDDSGLSVAEVAKASGHDAVMRLLLSGKDEPSSSRQGNAEPSPTISSEKRSVEEDPILE